MLNRKLLEVLARLHPAERKRLRLFLQSPYFNNAVPAEAIISLYDYIIEYDAEEAHPLLDKVVVFARFFPDKTYQENEKNSLDGLMSKLFGLVRSFLAQEQFRRDQRKSEKEELLAYLRFCRRHGLEDRFWQTEKALKKLQDEWPYRDAGYYHELFELSEEVAAFKTLTNSFQDDANIGMTSMYLDTYYSIQHLEIACALLYQQKFVQPGPAYDHNTQTDAILAHTVQIGINNLPLIEIYRLIILLLKDADNKDNHSIFETLLEQNKALIPFDTLCNLKAYQRFFWSRFYTKSGDPFFRFKLFDLYKEHFEEGYFYLDGQITVASFRVLIMFALKLGHFDWAKKVLDQHPPERICGTRYPAEAYNLNLAEYHFYKKEYDLAIDHLKYRLFENPNLSVLADVLLIKVYVETQDDLLESRMKAFEQKVRRVKIAEDTKVRYTNFLKKLDKIIRHIWQKKSARYDKMILELKSVPNIIEREWLLEKLEERCK